MDLYNKKVVIVVYASLAALLLFTFQNCSANMVTAFTAKPANACEKNVNTVTNLIRVSDNELETTKNQMTEEPKALFSKSAVDDEARYGTNRTPRAMKKNSAQNIPRSKTYKSAETGVKKVTLKYKKPIRKSASDDDMKIRLKKIKPKKTIKVTEN